MPSGYRGYLVWCDECGCEIRAIHVVPSEAWEAISHGDYALCVPCMTDRLSDAGLDVPIYAHSAHIEPPEWARKIVYGFKPVPIAHVQKHQTVQ